MISKFSKAYPRINLIAFGATPFPQNASAIQNAIAAFFLCISESGKTPIEPITSLLAAVIFF
jgi:hypothetical protein